MMYKSDEAISSRYISYEYNAGDISNLKLHILAYARDIGNILKTF